VKEHFSTLGAKTPRKYPVKHNWSVFETQRAEFQILSEFFRKKGELSGHLEKTETTKPKLLSQL